MDRRRFLAGLATQGVAVATPAWATPATKSSARDASLSTLAPNTARNLGPYANPDVHVGAQSITDYSGLAYDAAGRRICLFGGGHGPSQETDIRLFDLATLKWSSAYAPTPRAQMTAANGDSDRGRWRTTNQPYARHSYNMTLVAGRRFYMLMPWGMPDHLDGAAPPWGGSLCWYDFDAGQWSYSRYGFAGTPIVPWYFGAAAALDPRSGNIVVVGRNNAAGIGSVWLYDPREDEIRPSDIAIDVGGEPDLVYVPASDRFFVMQGDGRVWDLELDRRDVRRSRIAPVAVSGAAPSSPPGTVCGFAYDANNGVIGGNVTKGTFHAFDPATRVWTATPMRVERGSQGAPNQAFHCLEYDPDSGCFVFLQTDRGPDGVVVAANTWAYRHAAAAKVSFAAGVDDLAVRLDFGDGRVATFRGTGAVDQGDFVGEFVRQKSYLARDGAFPDWRVYFRVDADSSGRRLSGDASRDEIVVEYGRPSAGRPEHVTRRYAATITRNGKTIASYTVPVHWWYARWRHQPSPRRVVRAPDVLEARGWIPRFGRAGLFGLTANAHAIRWEGPMCAPARVGPEYAFDPGMASGGDNAQIGYLTEYAADYVLNGGEASLTSVRTEGEWCGNWCMHVRDDATGAVLDVRNRGLQWKSNGGAVVDAPPAPRPAHPAYVGIEVAHWYPCAHLPWLLTEDPFFLEELQFGANWHILYSYTPRVTQRLPGLVDPFQTRAYAWGLRELFLLAATCPRAVPRWLQPNAYWRACLEDNRAFAMQFVRSPARVHALFRTWTRSDADPAWQSAWLTAVVGIGVGQGFVDWEPVFAWSVGKQIAQTNGTSGWPRQWPVPYYSVPLRSRESLVAFPYRDTTPDASTCRSWSDYWEYYASGSDGRSDATGHRISTKGWDGHTLMQQFNDPGPSYFLHLRSALAIAAARGVKGARDCYDYLQGELQASVMPRFRVPGQARFALEPERAGRGA